LINPTPTKKARRCERRAFVFRAGEAACQNGCEYQIAILRLEERNDICILRDLHAIHAQEQEKYVMFFVNFHYPSSAF
jgi:hypothetical protein